MNKINLEKKPFGSVFSKFDYIELTTADEVTIKIKTNFLSRIGIKVLGLPHIGFRLRGRKILKNLPLYISDLLDAGCGTGVYSFTLANNVNKITAIDISQDKINYAEYVNPFKNINFVKGDLCKIKMRNSSVDVIVCSDVIEHIWKDELAFSELARVLRKGGTLLMTVPHDSAKNRKDYKKYGHERPGYSYELVEKMCKKNGLSIVKSELYSSQFTEKLSSLNYFFSKNYLILGTIFYPLYFLSILSDKFSRKEFQGIFFKITKL